MVLVCKPKNFSAVLVECRLGLAFFDLYYQKMRKFVLLFKVPFLW